MKPFSLTRVLGVLTVSLLVGLALLMGLSGCGKKKPPADLIILSPNNEKIRVEFKQAFEEWYQQKYGKHVEVEWRDVGATTVCTTYLINQFKNADTAGIDLYFGGGGPDYTRLADLGVLQPVELPKETMAQLPTNLGGIREYDEKGRWYGTVVSAFGIIYNSKLLKEQNLPLPKAWDDLAAPGMFGWLELADAQNSGSARAAYEMIVQSDPTWPGGWSKLLRIFANCKKIVSSASEIPRQVSDGDVLAGTAIDFYAYDQMSRNKDVGFVLVEGMTAFTPDPIAMLKGAPHPELAKQFIEFVMSEKGQALWCLPVGAPDGPKHDALFRQPLRRDVYEKYAGKMLPELVNPYKYAGSFKLDIEAYELRSSKLMGPLMQAAVLDSSSQIKQAWKAIIASGTKPELVAEFVALPDDLQDRDACLATAKKITKPEDESALRAAWQRFFRDKYEDIIKKASK